MRKTQRLAKLTRPRLYKAVARERLFHLLDKKLEHPVLWIAGPPGAGKTTLAASYIEKAAVSAIWYQIDPGDSDPATFFFYLKQAIEAVAESKARPLPLLTPEYLPDLPGFARRFLRDGFALLPDEALLVFDNYHDIAADSALHAAFTAALAEVPQGSNIIVLSRTAPPSAFAGALVNQTIAIVSWEDLRLTADETTAIAATRGITDLNLLRTLQEQSAGWMAGMTLMLERLCRGNRLESLQVAEALDTVFDYFAGLIFDNASEDMRDALTKTAFLPNVTAILAEALTGNADAIQYPEELHRRHLFTDRSVGREVSYQYHALFRGFLRKRAEQRFSRAQLSELLACSASLLKAHGQSENAVEIYRYGGAWEEAEELMLKLAPALLAEGRWRTLQEWLVSLPEEQLSRSAWAQYWLGNSHMQTASMHAREWLIKANDAFVRNGDIIGRLLSAAAILRSIHFAYKTFESMDQWIAQIDADLMTVPVFSNPADELTVHSAVLLVVIYRLPDYINQMASMNRIAELLDAPIDVNRRVSAAFVLLLAHTQAHRNDVALQLVRRVETSLDDPALTALNRAYWWMLVGYLHHRRGERAETEEALDRCDRIASENGLRQPEFLSRCYRAQHCCTWSDVQGALHALDGIEKSVSEDNPMAAAHYHKQRLFLEMVRGNADAAEMHARRGVAAALRLGSAFFSVAWLSQGAAALGMSGAYEDAAKWLDAAWIESENGFVRAYRPMIVASEFYVSHCRGLRSESERLLRKLFSITPDAEAFSYVGTMATVRDAVLTQAVATGISVEFVQSLIRKYEVTPPKHDLQFWPWPVKVYTLGRFELLIDGQSPGYSRKAPKKVLALLKVVIAFGSHDVPEQKLIDALWPDEDGDAGRRSLTATLHRLRKLLGCASAIQQIGGTLTLDHRHCWIDAVAFESKLDGGSVNAEAANSAMTLYRGSFLVQEQDAPWAVPRRERLRARFIELTGKVCAALEGEKKFDQAVDLYLRGIEADDLVEPFYQGLMRCYERLNRRSEAMGVYRRLCRTLSVTLGVTPSSTTRRLFESMSLS
jgi:LuxR family maltose regulon positive regulatory protein